MSCTLFSDSSHNVKLVLGVSFLDLILYILICSSFIDSFYCNNCTFPFLQNKYLLSLDIVFNIYFLFLFAYLCCCYVVILIQQLVLAVEFSV
jgi:hypothetical protein